MVYIGIFDLALLLLGAKIGGTIFSKLNQPSLVGELLAGIVLGSSMLGIVKPSAIVDATSQLGLMFLVLLTTLATDWKKIEKRVEAYSLVEAIRMIVPIFLIVYFIGGYFGWNIYTSALISVAFMHTSLAIASRTLTNLNQLGSIEGEAIIGIQVIDDMAAVLSIAILANFLQNSSMGFENMAKLLFIIVGFFVVMSKTGFRFINWAIGEVHKHGMEEALLGVTLVIAFLLATFTEQMGIATFLGVFLAGILLSKTSQANLISQKVKEVGESFFIPIFFASLGLSVNALSAYNQLFFILPFVGLAIVLKLLSSSLPLMFLGYRKDEALKIGSGLISLSEISLIILGIGLAAGVLNTALYSAIIVAFVLINMVSPIITSYIFRNGWVLGRKRFR